MTTIYNPDEIARLVREAREDDARMQRAPWRRFGPWPQVTIYVDHGVEAQDDHEPPEHVCDIYTTDQLTESPPDRCVAEADAIARIRNNLAAMADQLEAARLEIDRLRHANASLVPGAMLTATEIECLVAERDEARQHAAELERALAVERRTVGQLTASLPSD